jgi:hypothetical protein
MSTQKSTRTKQCHSHYPNEKQDTEHTYISLNQAYWKPSCEITAGLSWKNLKKYESKAARNIRPAVKNTIPGIGTGNYCTITRICVLNRVSMIFLGLSGFPNAFLSNNYCILKMTSRKSSCARMGPAKARRSTG